MAARLPTHSAETSSTQSRAKEHRFCAFMADLEDTTRSLRVRELDRRTMPALGRLPSRDLDIFGRPSTPVALRVSKPISTLRCWTSSEFAKRLFMARPPAGLQLCSLPFVIPIERSH